MLGGGMTLKVNPLLGCPLIIMTTAIWCNENEEPPDVVATKRWPWRQLPSPRRKIAKKSTERTHARAS
jgi:hypothetical protein